MTTSAMRNDHRVAGEFIDRGFIRLWLPITFGSTVVPIGFESNGMSMPGPLWWPLGHPFSGSTLAECIAHDYEIRTRAAPWRVVHLRLYRRLRQRGVGKVRAGLIGRGVLWFGPRW